MYFPLLTFCPKIMIMISNSLEEWAFRKYIKKINNNNDNNNNNNNNILNGQLISEYITQPIFFFTISKQKSRMRETKNLSTYADSRTDTILERLRDLSKKNRKNSIRNDSLFLRLYKLVHKCTSPPLEHLPRVDLPRVQSGTTPCF